MPPTLHPLAVGLACLLLAACGPPAPPTLGPGAPVRARPPTIAETDAAAASDRVLTPQDLSHRAPRGEIAALEELYATSSRDSPDRPKLLRRLAEDYAQLEVTALRDGGKGAEGAVQSARRKAIELYTKLVVEHPGWCSSGDKGCTDEVLFYLAYEHEQDHDPERARLAYRDLIKGWPMSRYVPNAYLAFAEAYFEESARDPPKLALAEKFYLEVLRFPLPDNKVAPYARYKLAFIHWNKGDTARALDEMTKVIEVCEANPKMSSAPQLAKEARRDLVPIYAAGGDPAKAYDFFEPRSGDQPGETERLSAMLVALAQAYADNGKLVEAVEVHLDWLSRGAGPKTCAVVKGIDGIIHRAGSNAGLLAKAQATAAASAPLMKARVECASAP